MLLTATLAQYARLMIKIGELFGVAKTPSIPGFAALATYQYD